MHSFFKNYGMINYEFEVMDYIIVIVGAAVLIAIIIFACICFPTYKSEEEWARLEDQADERYAKREKERREKEEKEMQDGENKDEENKGDAEWSPPPPASFALYEPFINYYLSQSKS